MSSALERERNATKRQTVFNKFNGRCAYCGCKLTGYDFHMDHIVPKLRGWTYKDIHISEKGGDEIENLNPCCKSCNSSKSTLSLEEFRIHITDRVHRLNNHSSNYQIAKRFGLIREIGITKPVVFYFETIINNAE